MALGIETTFGNSNQHPTSSGTEGDTRTGGNAGILPNDFHDCLRPSPEEMFENRRNSIEVKIRSNDRFYRHVDNAVYNVPLVSGQETVISQ